MPQVLAIDLHWPVHANLLEPALKSQVIESVKIRCFHQSKQNLKSLRIVQIQEYLSKKKHIVSECLCLEDGNFID